MANDSKIENTINKSIEETKNSVSELAIPTNTDLSASQSSEEEKISEFEQRVKSFGEARINSFADYLDWKELFDQFEEIFGDIDEFAHSIPETKYINIKERIETIISELMFYNDKYARRYNSWTASKGKNLEERADKQQILNFAVFSLFMTLLTFLLSNIVVITKTNFSIKSIIVVNLILLLVSSIIFLFIGLFLGLIRMQSKKGHICKTIILCLMPFMIATALVIVSIFM